MGDSAFRQGSGGPRRHDISQEKPVLDDGVDIFPLDHFYDAKT